jgi:glycosyltransferase involved in cell wall biosynthesis
MIGILLPVYNGEKFLSQQLDSIICQSNHDWHLLIRDDGSTDSSLQILKDYASRYQERITIVSDGLGNKGATECINILLGQRDFSYYMLCDQDDIWELNKIDVTLAEMKKVESSYHDLPLLVCSDACCIDENNNIICPSFFENQKFVDTTNDVHKSLALNVVQGSTILMNKNAKEIVSQIPNGLFHDWWIAVNIAFYGKISYIHQPLLKYRQHASNVVGALKVGPSYIFTKLFHYKKQWEIYSTMYRSLAFRPSIIKWAYYKFIYNIRRI